MNRIIESPRSLRVDKKHIPTVKKARVDGGFGNQKALAEAIGCSQSTAGNFLRGRSVDQNIFIKICNKLGLNWEDIAQLQDDTPETSLESNQTVQKHQLDLHQLCLDVVKEQLRRQLFSRPVIERNSGNEYPEVYVPLGVVKPKLLSNPKEHFSRDDFLKRIVKQRTNLAIVGNSGTGKSTLLEQIALHIAEEKIGFPICIPASALRGKTLKDYLLTDWLEEALPYLNPYTCQVSDIEKAELRKLFGTDKVWVLVDAIDEMSLPPEYNSRVEAIASQFTGWLSKPRIVFTCRLNVWQTDNFALPNFQIYHTVDFNDRQVNQFISSWFEKAGTQQLGERLQYKLSESKREPIQDLVKNPLFLSMMCGVWQLNPEDFPKSKTELYGKFIEDFYKWKKYKLRINWSQQQELNASLAKLALTAFEDSSAFKESKILNILDDTLFEKACTVGWLVQVAKDSQTKEPIYAFLHFSFQELFAAKAIAKNYDWHFFLHHVPGNPSEGSYRIFDPKWWNIYVFWMGEPSVTSASKSALLRALIAFEDESGFNFYRWRAYCIAAEGLPEFKDCPPALADEIVGTIVKLSAGDIVVEHQSLLLYRSIVKSARTALFGTDANRAVDFIVSKLSFILKNEHLQKDIAEILGEIGIGNPKAIQVVIQLLLRNPDKETRMIWVNCLGKIGNGDSNAIHTLTELFHQSPDDPSRLKVAEALIKVDPTNECAIAFVLDQNLSNSYLLSILDGVNNQIITNFLIHQHLNNATADSIRLEFARLLSLINPEEALSYLQELLDSPEEEIRLEAAWALHEISPNHPQVIPTLYNLLTCQNNLLIYRAVMILGKMNPGSTNAQDAINKLLNSEDTPIVLKTARQWFKIKANLKPLVNILLEIVRSSEDRCDREEAARTLVKISADDQNVTKSIIELFYTQRDEETHRVVAWYLGEIIPASPETIKVLIECLSSPIAQSVQWQAVISLGQVGERNLEVITALISLLQKRSIDENLRRKVVQSLGKIGFYDLNVIMALEKLVDKSKDKETCFLVACTLIQISTDKSKAIEALKKLMYSNTSQSSLFIPSQAAITLWQQLPGDINIIKTLIWLLLDNRGNPDSIRIILNPGEGIVQETIANFLKTLVFTEQLPTIINTIQSYASRQDAVSIKLYNSFASHIIWHYTQNLPYDKFYQACRGE